MSTAGIRPALYSGLGAILISVMVAAALWGIGTAQCYWYYLAYPKDRRSLKILVFAVWTTDTFHQVLIVQSLYFYLIQNFSNAAALDVHTWPLAVQVLVEAIISTLVQGFFIFRIWKLSGGNYSLVVVPSLVALAKFAMSAVYTVRGIGIHNLTIDLHKQHLVTLATYSAAAVTDIMIAVIMTYLLYTSKAASGRSGGIINRLMLYTINTGLITSLSSILSLVLSAVMTDNLIFVAIYFVTGRLIARKDTSTFLEFKMEASTVLTAPAVPPYMRTGGTGINCEPTSSIQNTKVHYNAMEADSENSSHIAAKS